MAGKVKVHASGTPDGGGTVVSISGGELGGHTASIRFLDPDYGPVYHRFDGGEGLVVTNDNVRGSVIVSVDEGEEVRVDVTPYKPGRGKVTDETRGDKARAGDPDAIAAIDGVARNISSTTTDEVAVAQNDGEVRKVDAANVNPKTEDPGAEPEVVARPGMNPDDVGKTQEAIDHPKKAVATPDDPASPHGPPEDDTSEKSDHASDKKK
jgi:hypothetical protein